MSLRCGRPMCTAACLVVTTVLLCVVIVLTVVFRQEHTPLYIPMVCVAGGKSLSEPEFTADGGLLVNGTANTRCYNPNSYDVYVRSAHGRLLLTLGNSSSPAGSVSSKSFTMPAESNCTIESSINMVFSAGQFGALLSYNNGFPVIISDVQSESQAELHVFGAHVRTPWVTTRTYCGNAANPLLAQNGPTSCSYSIGGVLDKVLPPDAPENTPFEVDDSPDKLLEYAHKRDAACFTVIGVGSVILCCVVALVIRMWCRVRRGIAEQVQERKQDNGKPQECCQQEDIETGLPTPSVQQEGQQQPLPVLLSNREMVVSEENKAKIVSAGRSPCSRSGEAESSSRVP
jgi:hypothetical protein